MADKSLVSIQESAAIPRTRRDIRLPAILFLLAVACQCYQLRQNNRIGVGWGHEMAGVARSLVDRGVFGNPFEPFETGPTAVEPPLYPLILAVAIKLLRSSVLIGCALVFANVVVNGLIAAILPALSTKLCIGRRGGIAAALLWMAGCRVAPAWDASYTLMGLILFCLFTAKADDGSDARRGAAAGLIAGLVLLLNPAALLVILPWAAFLWFEGKGSKARARYVAILLGLAVLCNVPWLVRNYTIWKQLVVRTNFGMTVYASDNDCAEAGMYENLVNGCYARKHPSVSRAEVELFRALGEVEYDRKRTADTLDWVRSHPGRFGRLTLERIVRFWLPNPENPKYTAYVTWSISILSLPGLVLLYRRRMAVTLFFLSVWLIYPAMYYIVVADMRYRYPCLWTSLLPAGYALAELWRRFRPYAVRCRNEGAALSQAFCLHCHSLRLTGTAYPNGSCLRYQAEVSRRLRYLLSSLALIAPCFWLPRIQSGDLESHVYNAWLAQLIARGQAPGLHIQPQWTNVLFDLELSALWPLGPVAAEKIAVALSVLIFVWGAFAFAAVAVPRKRTPWFLLPIVAVLAYGWVFHSGFFNYYLALGLGFWALALAWLPGRARMAGALAILALGLTAHMLAVAWVAGALGYRKLAGQMRPRFRPGLALGSVALLMAVGWLLEWSCPTSRNPLQATLVTGSDQIYVYGAKYRVLQLVLLAIWGILFVRVLKRSGWRRLAVDTPLQITAITAAGVLLIPGRIQFPGYHHALVYIAERMSLAVGICACAVLARAHPRRLELGAIAGLAAVFFAFLYADGRSVSRIEDRMRQAVAQLPPGSRVVSSVSDPSSRADPLVHLIDRVCVGRCYSFANFEPSTAAFRIRAEKGNPVVVDNYADSYALQTGGYIVKPADLPLYGLFPVSGSAEFTVRPLQAAETFQVARLEERR